MIKRKGWKSFSSVEERGEKNYERCLKSGYYGNKSRFFSFHWKFIDFSAHPGARSKLYKNFFFPIQPTSSTVRKHEIHLRRELIGRFNFWFTRSGGQKADLRIDDKKMLSCLRPCLWFRVAHGCRILDLKTVDNEFTASSLRVEMAKFKHMCGEKLKDSICEIQTSKDTTTVMQSKLIDSVFGKFPFLDRIVISKCWT